MNLLAHVLVSYGIGSYYTSEPRLIVLAILIGVLPDFDHIPKLKKALESGRFGAESRSVFHELAGLSLFSTIALALSLWIPFGIVFYPLLSHYLMDFLTRSTRPFYPFSKNVIHLGIYPKSYFGMVLADVFVTGAVVLWLIL